MCFWLCCSGPGSSKLKQSVSSLSCVDPVSDEGPLPSGYNLLPIHPRHIFEVGEKHWYVFMAVLFLTRFFKTTTKHDFPRRCSPPGLTTPNLSASLILTWNKSAQLKKTVESGGWVILVGSPQQGPWLNNALCTHHSPPNNQSQFSS